MVMQAATVAQEPGRIAPGRDICDVYGAKLGSIVRVFQEDPHGDLTPIAGVTWDPELGDQRGVMEVKTGFLGLGKHLFIPCAAVRDVTHECVFLAVHRGEVEQQGWHTRPEHLAHSAAYGDPDAHGAGNAPDPPGVSGAHSAAYGDPDPHGGQSVQTGHVAPDVPAIVTPDHLGPVVAPDDWLGDTTELDQEWEAIRPIFQARWQEHFALGGARWEAYALRYRFAWEMHRRPDLFGKSWIMAQPELRDAWELRHPELPWDIVCENIRDAWELTSQLHAAVHT